MVVTFLVKVEKVEMHPNEIWDFKPSFGQHVLWIVFNIQQSMLPHRQRKSGYVPVLATT